jgi:glycosyltransferase involved in cell wall biosynthesis
MENFELTILMPCLNEAETIGICISKAKNYLEQKRINGEILIADNGSTDGSTEIANNLGARVVEIKERGYGAALIGGIDAARGTYVIMGDADDSYDFENLDEFVDNLRKGYDLVMGNRFRGGVKPGAMPFLHQYLGNPILSFLGRTFFRNSIGDYHCGLRGFNKISIQKIDLKTTGMEFATEMVVKAAINHLKIIEVPTTLSPDGRTRKPHLRTWRDGWRHLRFMLMYAPNWLFLYPGILLMAICLVIGIRLLTGPIFVGGIGLDVHTLVVSQLGFIIGYQAVNYYVFSKIIAIKQGLIPDDDKVKHLFSIFNLERGLLIGFLLFIIGLVMFVLMIVNWGASSFGSINVEDGMRIIIPSSLFIAIGIQTILSSFLLSQIGLDTKK